MKNVAIIVQKLYGGGAERTASNLSIILNGKYNIHLIVFDGSNIKYPYAGNLHVLDIPHTDGKLKKISNLIKRVREVKKIKKVENIDVSISLMPGANLVNVLSKTGDKIITSIRNQMSKSSSESSIKSQIRFTSKKSDCIVTLSDGVRNDLINYFGIRGDKIYTVYNPCDGELLLKNALIHDVSDIEMPQYSISTMGRLLEQKGIWHLIRAMTEVVKTVPEAKLFVFGEGPLEANLKELSSELGLSDNVVFKGFVEAPHSYIRKSKVFVFPSLYEGLGNALLEAMACGVPCIASDCLSGPREIIAPGSKVKESLPDVEYCEYGVLVSVGDKGHFNSNESLTAAEHQISAAIIELLTNSDLNKKYVEKSLSRIRDFSPEAISRAWCEVIES